LRCPFCGGSLHPYPLSASEASSDTIQTGLLGCACSAYPVVAGVPFLRTGHLARSALNLIDQGQKNEALCLLLGLADQKRAEFETLLREKKRFTYQACLKVLSPNPEGNYLLYRFSDPTFLVTDSILRAIGQNHIAGDGRILDLCGGSGHVTRTLGKLSKGHEVWLADLEFWKLWLAQQFVAPQCEAVCCDAAQPLPFARGSFAFTLCSDAFPFIWPRRLLAGEMRRLVGPQGIVMATQLHNALCENPSEGAHLEPAAWRALFEEVPAKLFKESAVLDSVLEGKAIDLSVQNTDADLQSEPALIALSTTRENFFREYSLPESHTLLHSPALNPLYHCQDIGSNKVCTLRFPSTFYESEFEACRRYLPEKLELPMNAFNSLKEHLSKDRWTELIRNRILLDLPERYV
jgi:hypothetical protein